MKKLIKQLVNRLLEARGLEIKRKVKAIPSCNTLEAVMQGLISSEKVINVVQVGANDGAHGDPIYNLLMENKEFTKALLIEPQPDIIQYLECSYVSHPNVSIYNGAIGKDDHLLLYRIKSELWDSFHAPYLEDAPNYRAPSGLTSANIQHVINAAREYLEDTQIAEDAIEEIRVPSKFLSDLLSDMNFPTKIHLLQVDVEGADDKVIYACNINELKPMVINYEQKHLGSDRKAELENYLFRHGYKLYNWNASDTLAIQMPNK